MSGCCVLAGVVGSTARWLWPCILLRLRSPKRQLGHPPRAMLLCQRRRRRRCCLDCSPFQWQPQPRLEWPPAPLPPATPLQRMGLAAAAPAAAAGCTPGFAGRSAQGLRWPPPRGSASPAAPAAAPVQGRKGTTDRAWGKWLACKFNFLLLPALALVCWGCCWCAIWSRVTAP